MTSTRHFNIEYAQTECDSSEENESDFCPKKTNPLKHKTELCKTYSELGKCGYGEKCRFAHGKYELVNVFLKRDQLKKCNGFWGKGICCYGVRCQFRHKNEEHEEQSVLAVAKGVFGFERKKCSRLLKILENA